MVPYTVYCYQRGLGYWRDNDPGSFMDFRIYIRSGWINMEVAAIVVGFLFLYLVPFPFLLAPVSFALWFMSMDIAPLFRDFNELNAFDIRRKISIVFGIGLIILGRFMEWKMGSDPDFGFWLYLFGLITFWFPLVFHPVTNDVLAQTVFFLINVSLVLVGSQLDRVTFHLFGAVGVALTASSYFQRDRIETSFILWLLKALAAVALFSNGIKTGGTMEILNGVVCFVIFNIEGLMFVQKGEQYNILILLTNLGFVSCGSTFNQPMDLWLFQLPSSSIVMSFMSLSVCLYHVKILQYYQNRFNLNGKDVRFLTYRLFVNVLITFVLLFFKQYWWAWCGVVGIPVIAMLTQPYGRQDGATVVTMLSQFTILLGSIAIAMFINSNIFYLISCLCMYATIIVYTMTTNYDYRSNVACGLSVFLIILAIPMQSKFMIVIGGFYIFGYLSHLAYNTFKKSLIFPLVLVGLGLGLIFIGVVYQRYEDALYNFSTSLIPVHHFQSFNRFIFSIDWYSMYIKNARFSTILQNPFIWLMWSGPMIHSLSVESIPYASWFCGVAIGVVLLTMSYMKAITDHCPNLTGKVKVCLLFCCCLFVIVCLLMHSIVTGGMLLLCALINNDSNHSNRTIVLRSIIVLLQISRLSLGLDRDAGSGIIIELEGTKPVQLSQPHYVSLNLNGDLFWKKMSQQFGAIPVKVLRSVVS